MFGTFQQSCLRIEVSATQQQLSDALLNPSALQRWIWPQFIQNHLPPELYAGLVFTSWAGPIPLEHQVTSVSTGHLCCVLRQSIDGFHEWHWGAGWVQSRLEGVSLLPLRLSNATAIARLKTYLNLTAT